MKLSKERKPCCRLLLTATIFAIMRQKIILCPLDKGLYSKKYCKWLLFVYIRQSVTFVVICKQQIRKWIALYAWTCLSICTYTVLEARKDYGMYCFVKLYVSVSGFFLQIRDLLVSINK